MLACLPEITGEINTIEREGTFVAAKDGTQLYVQSFLPKNTIHSQVLCLPGIGNYGWYYEPLALHLNRRGIAVHAVDYRGTGLSGGARWDMSCVENWVQDVMDALEHLNEAGLPIFLLGHSLGGALALQAAPKAQRLLRGMIVAAPAMTVESVALPWKNYLLFPIGLLCVPKRPLIRLPVPSYEEMIKDHADEDLARRLLEDPYRVEKISARCGMVLNSVRSMPGANKAAAATSIPTLVICGTDDSALEGATQYFHSLSSTDKHLAVVPRQHHHLLRSCVENGVGDILSEWICGQLLEEREPQKA